MFWLCLVTINYKECLLVNYLLGAEPSIVFCYEVIVKRPARLCVLCPNCTYVKFCQLFSLIYLLLCEVLSLKTKVEDTRCTAGACSNTLGQQTTDYLKGAVWKPFRHRLLRITKEDEDWYPEPVEKHKYCESDQLIVLT